MGTLLFKLGVRKLDFMFDFFLYILCDFMKNKEVRNIHKFTLLLISVADKHV